MASSALTCRLSVKAASGMLVGGCRRAVEALPGRASLNMYVCTPARRAEKQRENFAARIILDLIS